MSPSEWVSLAVGLGGVLVAALTLWHSSSLGRERRYELRVKALLETAALLEEQPIEGASDIGRDHAKARSDLINALVIEAHANAVLYLRRVGRLSRPGSYFMALFLGAYGIVIFAMGAGSLGTSPLPLPKFIAGLLLIGTALVLLAMGVAEFRRRHSTRNIRMTIGLIDEVSIEGVQQLINGGKNLLSRRRRR